MYSKKMYCIQDRIQPNYEPFGDGDLELMHCPSPLYAAQQPWNSSVCPPQPGQDNLEPGRSSGTMLSRFESPASAFYAAERCMGFPQNGCQASSIDQTKCSQYSKNCEVEFPLYRSCENFSISSAEKCYDVRSNGLAATTISPHKRDGLPADDAAYVWRRISGPFNEQLNCKVSGNSYCYPLAQMSFSSKQEKQSPKFSSGSNCSSSTSGYSSSTGLIMSNKTRIRWTQDLHEKFVECVNRLGGAEKATPKAVLKLMDSDGLTIFHIKSHLQKYRIAKYMPDSEKGRNDRRLSPDDFPRLDVKNGLQIKEALQLQLDVQRRLHEQLEIQRNLQLRIEEQGRQLRMMFNEQQKTTKALRNNQDENSHEHGHFSTADGSENSYFQSKIS